MSLHYNIRAHTSTSDVMVGESNYLEKLYFDLRRYYQYRYVINKDVINLKSKYILIDYIHDTLIFTLSLIPEKAGVVLRNPFRFCFLVFQHAYTLKMKDNLCFKGYR